MGNDKPNFGDHPKDYCPGKSYYSVSCLCGIFAEDMLGKICKMRGLKYEDSMSHWKPLTADQLEEFKVLVTGSLWQQIS